MTIKELKTILQYQEPSFGYKGKEYSICSPNGRYYVWSEDNPSDAELEFSSVDDLVNNWMIQGKPLRDILEDIDFE